MQLGVDSRLAVSPFCGACISLRACCSVPHRLRPSPLAPPCSGSNDAQATLPHQGIHTPTEVQAAAIPHIVAGANVAVQCHTGSGKTLAYLLPVLSLAIARNKAEWEGVTRRTRGQAGTVQAVVVAPSRELAMQIVRVAQSLLPDSARRAVQQAIGGANMARQVEALRKDKPVLVVGTPGRLAELSRDGTLQTHK